MFNRIFSIVLAIFFLTAGLTGCKTTQQAAAPDKPAFEPFHAIVDMDFVKQHVSIPMSEDVMLIDARPYKPKYIKGHIPMAVSIPDSQFDKMTDKLPANKDALLIYYCGGTHCKLSHKSAMKAEKLGYTNVKVYAEGYPHPATRHPPRATPTLRSNATKRLAPSSCSAPPCSPSPTRPTWSPSPAGSSPRAARR